MTDLSPCHCGSGVAFKDCCQRYLAGNLAAPTAEALMRSRYTAYVLELEPYLLATWHPDTRPSGLHFEQEPRQKWLGLAIKRASGDERRAVVEFVARYKVSGRAFRLHETSRFERIEGRWFYRDGDLA